MISPVFPDTPGALGAAVLKNLVALVKALQQGDDDSFTAHVLASLLCYGGCALGKFWHLLERTVNVQTDTYDCAEPFIGSAAGLNQNATELLPRHQHIIGPF